MDTGNEKNSTTSKVDIRLKSLLSDLKNYQDLLKNPETLVKDKEIIKKTIKVKQQKISDYIKKKTKEENLKKQQEERIDKNLRLYIQSTPYTATFDLFKGLFKY